MLDKTEYFFTKIYRMKFLIYIFLFTTIVIAFSFHSCQSDAAANQKIDQPNIVLIFIDDMGYADVGCFGATDYQTPNIDWLAKEGARFTNFYVSQAVCSASRASLLTGCYSERVGIQGALNPNSNIGINPDETIIPEMLKEAGYATGIFGKWHLGHHHKFLPLQHGFDEYVGVPYSNDMWPVGYDGIPVTSTGKHKSNYPLLPLFKGNNIIDTISTLEDQAMLTTIYTNKAVEFIEEHKNEPFFLYMPHSMVHVPIAVSEKFKNKSGKGLFADVMMELDWSVGEILKALKDNDLDENTLVIFTSDNGPWLNYGNHAGSAGPLREGKGTMWEGGSRVSAAMRWPGNIPVGIEVNQIASTIDILPTLSEITGVALPEKKIDGVSILSLLTGQKDAKPRNQFYYYYAGDLIAVRKDNWKLVFPHKFRSYEGIEPGNNGFPGPYGKGIITELELYDLDNDIGETINLASKYPKIVEKLAIIGDSAREELGDRILNMKGKAVRKPGRIYQKKKTVDHIAVGKNISVKSKASYKYSGHGDITLINGVLGSLDFTDEEWLGFQGMDFEAVIDLQDITEIKHIESNFMVAEGAWIFSPVKVDFYVSEDNLKYNLIKTSFKEVVMEDPKHKTMQFFADIENHPIRYIKKIPENIGTSPDWHPGAAGTAWLFVDEIIIK